MIAILDYGSGNIRSVQRALERIGLSVEVTSDLKVAQEASALVVPGVGAFASCLSQLRAIGGVEMITERVARGAAVLGICVGMQILFEGSDEGEASDGLALIPGRVRRLDAPVLPHIGWNRVSVHPKSRVFAGIESERFYFVHSYAVTSRPAAAINSTSEYGEEFLAATEYGALTAFQFHPEKSGAAGAKALSNWAATI